MLESWMTPSVFAGTEAINEYELSQTEAGRRRIVSHRKTFIQEQDLDWLVANGIEIVRLPIGYWLGDSTPPYVSQLATIDWLMQQTEQRGIKVLIDLHAAPGAQNRAAHSGSGNRKHYEPWLNDPASQAETIEALEYLARRYGNFENLWGLQMLNEPQVGTTGWKLVGFYRRAYKRLSKILPNEVNLVFSDGYAPLLITGALSWPLRRSNRVVIDSHFYQCMSVDDKRRSFSDQLAKVSRRRRTINLLSYFQPVIVGEWSAVLPYKLSSQQQEQYYQAQARNHSGALAEFYWNYNTEGVSAWNYRSMIDSRRIN